MVKDVEKCCRRPIMLAEASEDFLGKRCRKRAVDAAKARERDSHLVRGARARGFELADCAWREAQAERGSESDGSAAVSDRGPASRCDQSSSKWTA